MYIDITIPWSKYDVFSMNIFFSDLGWDKLVEFISI
jgi:hypothetical protein